MLAVNDCLVSDKVGEVCFCCNLENCKGCCCVEGDLGAPLEPDEISLIEDYKEDIYEYMTDAGIEVVRNNGVFAPGLGNDFVTPLIDDRDCAFLYYDDKKIARCAIETAYRDGKIPFNKPISCHLYPIRLNIYGDVTAVNYDYWDICDDALKLGKERNIRLYQFLKEPLIRRFGEEWYSKLCDEIERH